MEQRTVTELERQLTEAVIDVMVSMGPKRLPLAPSEHTMHLMAKAATAVYESAVENWEIAKKE